MYPRQQLNELAARKAVLQTRISLQRARGTLEFASVLPPLKVADALWQRWRALAPAVRNVVLPAAALIFQRQSRRGSWVRSAMRVLPIVQAIRNGLAPRR